MQAKRDYSAPIEKSGMQSLVNRNGMSPMALDEACYLSTREGQDETRVKVAK